MQLLGGKVTSFSSKHEKLNNKQEQTLSSEFCLREHSLSDLLHTLTTVQTKDFALSSGVVIGTEYAQGRDDLHVLQAELVLVEVALAVLAKNLTHLGLRLIRIENSLFNNHPFLKKSEQNLEKIGHRLLQLKSILKNKNDHLRQSSFQEIITDLSLEIQKIEKNLSSAFFTTERLVSLGLHNPESEDTQSYFFVEQDLTESVFESPGHCDDRLCLPLPDQNYKKIMNDVLKVKDSLLEVRAPLMLYLQRQTELESQTQALSFRLKSGVLFLNQENKKLSLELQKKSERASFFFTAFWALVLVSGVSVVVAYFYGHRQNASVV